MSKTLEELIDLQKELLAQSAIDEYYGDRVRNYVLEENNFVAERDISQYIPQYICPHSDECEVDMKDKCHHVKPHDRSEECKCECYDWKEMNHNRECLNCIPYEPPKPPEPFISKEDFHV